MSRSNDDHEHYVAGQVTEGARQRERRILAALRPRAGEGPRPRRTTEDVIRIANEDAPGLPLLTQSATLADLRCMVESGLVEQVVVYRLAEQKGGR